MVTSVGRHGKARHFTLSVHNPRPLSQALRHSLELLATLMEDRREPFEDALEEQPAARGRSNMTTINLNGYQYTRAWSSQRKISYRCSVYRGTGCAGKVDFLASTRQFENFVEHSCRCHADPAPPQVDIRVLMQTEVDRLALANLATPALQIWDMVDAQFYRGATDQALRGLTQQQVTGRVYRTRALHFGGNIHGRIEVPPLSRVHGQALNFFQFHFISGLNTRDVPSRIVGWAHPLLIELLKYAGTTVFVDGTFRCVPRGFKQCVVAMVHDRATCFYVPVFYVLSTARTMVAYYDIFHFIIQATDQQLEPAEIVCDFEAALIQAVQVQFPNADIIGCLFHFKQAIRRRMRRLAIPEQGATIAMRVACWTC
jgi:hypothetical protein